MKAKTQSKVSQRVFAVIGSLLICVAFGILIYDIYTYVRQFDQRDWETASATVIGVQERTHNIKGPDATAYYDIEYQYEVNGNVYTGLIDGINTAKDLNETFDIRYDPNAPQNSTHYLKPNNGFIVSGILGFLVFGGIGSRMVLIVFGKNKKQYIRH